MAEKPDEHCIGQALVHAAEATMQTLRAGKLTVVTAESCTAGLVAAALAQAEGASDALHGAFVTYTKDNKSKALGVDPALLEKRGSVNGEVVCQMASGALDRSPADIALAVSGVLGPAPDEDGNPVGVVFFACCKRGAEPEVERKNYGEQPHDVLTRAAVADALKMIASCAEH